jgi:hypothetical protein
MAGNTVIQAVPVPLSQLATLIPTQSLNVGTMTITPTDTGVPNSVNAEFAARLAKAGGRLSGALTLAGDPSLNLNPTTKQYADAVLDAAVMRAGATTYPVISGSGVNYASMRFANCSALKGYSGFGTLATSFTISDNNGHALCT